MPLWRVFASAPPPAAPPPRAPAPRAAAWPRNSRPAAPAAAEFTALASWFLVHRGDPPAEVERGLKLPAPPRTAGQHLAADAAFRLLPTVHRRARALDPRDVLTARLEELLRRWPL